MKLSNKVVLITLGMAVLSVMIATLILLTNEHRAAQEDAIYRKENTATLQKLRKFHPQPPVTDPANP